MIFWVATVATVLTTWSTSTCALARSERPIVSDARAASSEVDESTSLDEAPRALLGPGFVYAPGMGGSIACGPRALAEEALIGQVLEAQAAAGIDAQLAAIVTTDATGCDALYYVPVENDILGIGYGYLGSGETFDLSPDAALQGIAFLNDMPYWDSYPEELRTTFLHEVGHRWGARIGARQGDRDLQLTGRQSGHWSYFLDTGGSPLEGNRFDPSAPLVTATPEVRVAYSPLDLYLMGAISPAEVGPLRLLDEASAQGVDCLGHAVTPASPPQVCEPKKLAGTWLELSIDDVVSKEGPRVPSAVDAPQHYTFAAFVFGSRGSAWSEEACRRTASTLLARMDEFTRATGDRLFLDNVAAEGLSCEDLIAATTEQRRDAAPSHCSTSGATPRNANGWLSVLASLVALGSTRRWYRRHRDA